MYSMRMKLLIPLLISCCFACSTESEYRTGIVSPGTKSGVKFDKTKWRVREGLDYPYRNEMLNDIVYNDTVRTLNKNEVLDLLGEPDRSNEGYLYYLIAQKRLGYWPLHTRTMVIKLSDDRTIEWIKIHE